ATVCACPTTEASLGDGCVPSDLLHEAGIPLAIGSDSNVRLDPLEELRELELCARRRTLRRDVLPLAALLAAGSAGGARSLALPEVRLEVGAPADLVAVDLTSEPLAGLDDGELANALVFSGDAGLVTDTWVGGER
ncbi:MAG: formimidoylglutamate deiminase, partial [Gaiellaceae bacterium]|nr:formimidoylglutamate deiminase [Gaiellaceae bacterium]